MIHLVLGVFFSVLFTGSLIFCILAIRAVSSYMRYRLDPAPFMPFISVLRPLSGAEEGLRENLRSFFTQDYPEFELLFAVAHEDDPAARIAREVMAEFPETHSQLIVSGDAPTPNRKVHNLRSMYALARYQIIVMADSDVRTGPDLLRVVSAEMNDAQVALVTCPYRASAGNSIWTATEAIGLNTEFLAQVLVSRFLRLERRKSLDFALGPTLAIRREALDAIGGLDELQHYLAEDFVMGSRVAQLGGGVILSSFIVEHRLGSQTFAANFAHRLRWARSTRRSRPRGYLGQIFTNPLPLAVLTMVSLPRMWMILIPALGLRAWVAWATSQRVLRDPLTRDFWYLVPLQDFASFFVWIAGFLGSRIEWRGKKIKLARNGRFVQP